ncbi:MAG TPA: DnaJ domain-containing protein [Pyrinomonadaceae bacterium]|nr:DnaJ domain-containing protein [Pyrinomonadaceae bacterium]
MDELNKYYELLGVRPGASVQELKTAHRDMAKVWHPDRFAHDPRLQQKAQEKLKEINEAYDQLTSARTGRRPRPAAPPAQEAHAPQQPAPARRGRWQLVLLALSISGVVFFYAFRALLTSADERQAQSVAQSQPQTSEDNRKPEGVTAAPKPTRPRQADAQKESPQIGTPAAPAEVRALPTVTVTIDPTTGQLATPACPAKSRMTYPAGAEPRQACTAAHRTEATPEAAPPRQKESRLKSFGKRLKGIITSTDN